MNKKIMYLMIGILLVSIVRADTNVSIGVSSTEDINVWANPNTPGLTTYILDGVDYRQSISNLYAHDMSMSYIFSRLSATFLKKDYRTK